MSNPHFQVVSENQSEATEGPDPFDPARLRLDQSFTETLGVKPLLTTVPVGRPSPQDFFRVHPDESYRVNLAIIDLKTDREIYLVPPGMVPELSNELVPVTLFTIVSRRGVLRLWPVRLPGADGKSNAWWGVSASRGRGWDRKLG